MAVSKVKGGRGGFVSIDKSIESIELWQAYQIHLAGKAFSIT
jgi:hypothetical protein